MDPDNLRQHTTTTRISSIYGMGCFFVLLCVMACSTEVRHSATTAGTQDSLPFMHSIGISTLISDSGIIRYHLVAEEWDIHTPENQAATWKFNKGLLMLRLDEDMNVDLYVQSDTAYLHRQQTWELRGRVRIRNVQGTKFNTEELFWDLNKHEMWNHSHMTIITPERTLEGTEFRSNEQMTRYSVMNSSGDFPVSDAEETTEQADSLSNDGAATSATEPGTSTESQQPQHKQRNTNATPVKTPASESSRHEPEHKK